MSEKKILVPNIGDFKNVEVIEVLVKSGQHIKKNDPLPSCRYSAKSIYKNDPLHSCRYLAKSIHKKRSLALSPIFSKVNPEAEGRQ